MDREANIKASELIERGDKIYNIIVGNSGVLPFELKITKEDLIKDGVATDPAWKWLGGVLINYYAKNPMNGGEVSEKWVGAKADKNKNVKYGDTILGTFKSGDKTYFLMIVKPQVPIERWSIELPSGAIKPGETPIDAAKRETIEETGAIISDAEILVKNLAHMPHLGMTLDYLVHVNVTGFTVQTTDEKEEKPIMPFLATPEQVIWYMTNDSPMVYTATRLGFLHFLTFTEEGNRIMQQIDRHYLEGLLRK
ncbi:MAG: NUDIX domain-containing protein [Candidatus Micrarchaeia archaeon]